jgi:hypothetical protein
MGDFKAMRLGLTLATAAALVGCGGAPTERASSTRHGLDGLPVWVVDSLSRVAPHDPVGPNASAVLAAGRGEYESFQIIVSGGPSGLTNVSVATSDLTGRLGTLIAKSQLSLYRENYSNVTSSSPDWGGPNRPLGPGTYPDGLIPFVDPTTGASLSGSGAALIAVPFTLAAGQNQPIWVDVLVPRDATPGLYAGTYTVTSDQGSFTGNIALTAWAFTLPLRPSLKSSFLVWNSVPQAALEELLRNKLDPLQAPPAEQQALMATFGLDSVGLPFFSGANVGNCSMDAPPSVASIQAAAAANQPGLYTYTYSADEIGACSSLYPIVKQWGANMHAAGVDNLVTMAPVPALFDDGSGSGRSAVDVWTMLPVTYDGSQSTGQALMKGDTLWSYNTLVQDAYSPKWEVDFLPINFRIQPGFISQSLSLTGILYWKVDAWSPDPWTDINNAGKYSSSNYPGEAVLLYPGQDVGIPGAAPSMRLKWLRDGVEDYEYVELLKKAGEGTWALQQAASVGKDWKNWTQNTTTLTVVRQALGTKLDQLGGDAGGATDGGDAATDGGQ